MTEPYKVKKRFAAILTRTKKGDIRGSYEWIALFIAWVVAAQSQKANSEIQASKETQ